MRSVWIIAAASICAALLAGGRTTRAAAPEQRELPKPAARNNVKLCSAGELPDEGSCVHVADDDGFSTGEVRPNVHRDRGGRTVTYDQIPRSPDRPANYDAYRYPTAPGLAAGRSVVSGYDLDAPDDRQRRGATLRAVGHGGVDLPQSRNAPVRMLALDHQEGDATVAYVGALFGNSVVTLHAVREASGLREYLLIFGHLQAPAAGLEKGSVLREGDLVGGVGDSGSPELVHLHLEARRVREGEAPMKATSADALLNQSIVTDPRNVLPLR